MRYNTGNPVGPDGSNSPFDLYDNSGIIDLLVNGPLGEYLDRLGVPMKSWRGIMQQVTDYLIAQGYESVYLTYGAGVVVERQTQLVQRSGELYRVMNAADIPLTLTGNWTTDAPKLQAVGDAALRQALSSPTGSSLVGFNSPFSGVADQTVEQALARRYPTVEEYGAVGDNLVDDTAAIQLAVKELGTLGGGRLQLTPGKKYYVPGTVIIPSGVSIDFCGSTLRGNRPGGSTASMFQSGYFDTSGNLVSNASLPNEALMLDQIHVGNGTIRDAYRAFSFKNANRTCSLYDLTFEGCLQAWELTRCFSIGLRNHFAHGSSQASVATYKMVEAINAITCERIRAVTDFGFEVNGGSGGNGAIVFLNCDYEGGSRGYYVSGNIHGVSWIGGYNEAVTGVLYDFADAVDVTASWIGNYNFLIDTYIREPVSNSAYLRGSWDSSNTILGTGQVEGAHTYPGTFNVRHPQNSIKFELKDVFESATSLPSNFNVDLQADVRQIAVRWGSNAGDVITKNTLHGGVIPLHFSGDVGRSYPNQVAFATHKAFAPGATNITVLVDTKIKYRPDTSFARYKLSVEDGSGIHTLYGDIYGNVASPRDSTGKTVTVSDAGGYMRLELAGFSSPGGVYTCTGTVQLLT